MAASLAAPLRAAAALPSVAGALLRTIRLARDAVKGSQRFGHELMEDACSVLAAAVASDSDSRASIDSNDGKTWAEFVKFICKGADRRCVTVLLRFGSALRGNKPPDVAAEQADKAAKTAASEAAAEAHMQELLVRRWLKLLLTICLSRAAQSVNVRKLFGQGSNWLTEAAGRIRHFYWLQNEEQQGAAAAGQQDKQARRKRRARGGRIYRGGKQARGDERQAKAPSGQTVFAPRNKAT